MAGIDRRHLLKLGAALPLAVHALNRDLVAETPRHDPPQRVIFICNSLGFHAPFFYPKKSGDLASSEYLKEFEVAEKMTVFEKFFHPGMETSNHDSEKSFLTGTPNPQSANFVNGRSVDQYLIDEIGTETRFPSLNFSLYDRGWGCAWNERGSAIPPWHDGEKIFQKLFGDEETAEKKNRLQNDLIIIESLRRDVVQLRATGASRSRVEHYQTVLRQLESKLEHEKHWLDTPKPKVSNSLNADREFEFSAKVENLFELAKLALRTDSTRVITITLDWIYGAIQVPGASGGWHTLSHHGGRPEILSKLSRVEIDILKHFHRFLIDLEQIKEGSGTLLDQTTIIMGSNFGDSSNHTCHALPLIVAGGGYRHQGHHVLEKPTPLCNLYLELLHKHDVGLKKFGSSERDQGLLQG